MAELNMVSYKLQDLQFFNKLDKPGQVNLENNFSFSVNSSGLVRYAFMRAAVQMYVGM